MIKKLIAVLMLSLLISACAQHSAFLSEPPGAQVIVDGQQIGVTPCNLDYNLSTGNSHDVTVVKNGYEPVHFVVETDEVDNDARNRWLAAGVVWSPLWLGTFFTKKLKDSYNFILREEAPSMTASVNQDVEESASSF